MLSRVLAWKVAVTAGFFMAAKTGHLRSWLAASRRSMVTSLRPRAGTLAMRSRLTSSLRVEEGLEVGEEIADLAAVEEALAADQVVAHAGLAQGGFQRARLGVGAEQDRLVRPRHALGQPRVFDLLDDGPRLLLVVGKGVQGDLRPVALSATRASCRGGGRCA